MRIGWWLLGVLATCVACSRSEASKPNVAVSASASPNAAPLLSNVPAPPPSDLNQKNLRGSVLRAEEKPLPPVRYRHEAPRVGTPAAAAFAVRSGPGGWSRYDATTYGMLIDVQGGVWREETPYRSAPVRTLVGRVESAQVRKMRELAADVARSPARSASPGCVDCGSSGYVVFGVPGAGKDGALLAAGGSWPRESGSTSVRTALLWLEAVDRRALVLPRPEPFDLPLPILGELSDERGHGEPSLQDPALELSSGRGDWPQGIFVSRAGYVYRFRDRGASQRERRFVGKVERGALSRILAAAQSCRDAEWLPAKSGKDRGAYRALFLAAAGSEPLLISLDEPGHGGRLTGESASLVIAWIYALDEQALPFEGL